MQRNSYCSLNGPSFFVSKSKIPPLYIPPTLQIVRSALGPKFRGADGKPTTEPFQGMRVDLNTLRQRTFNVTISFLYFCSYTTFHRIVWRAWNLGKSVRNGMSTTYE